MFKSEQIKKILTLESIGLAGIVFFIWADEIFDLPHNLLRAPSSAVNIEESVLETAIVLVFGLLLIFATAAKGEVEGVRKKIDVIVKAMADGLIVCDVNRQVIRFNSAASELLRLSWSQKKIHSISELPVTLINQINDTLDEKPVPSLMWEMPPVGDASPRVLESQSNIAYANSGHKLGVITLIRDVTQKYELERLKDEFISTAAHELRTPLTAIKGFTEILLSGTPLTSEQEGEFKQLVLNNAINLEKIISDLLDLSRVHSGKVILLNKEACCLSEILSKLSGSCGFLYPDYRFEIDIPDLPAATLVDREKIEQVFHNLISNAVKYSSPGKSILIRCEQNLERTRVTIADNGIGMKPEEVDKVFEKFYRADASNTALPGLGLGMAIVKNIIEGHGGEISVESKYKEGTTVSFSLPNISLP